MSLAYGALSELEADLATVVDQHKIAEHAGTSPLVLARYLIRQMDNFRETIQERASDEFSITSPMGGTSEETGDEQPS